MPKLVWSCENQTGSAGDFTSSVMSMTYTYGRQTYMDNYAGGNLAITIKNNTNQIAGFALNDRISIEALVSPIGGNAFEQQFWVAEIQYDDYPGNTGMPTATIICADALNRVGRALGNGYSVTAGTTGAQVDAMDSAPTWPPNVFTTSNLPSSQASATTLTTSFANRINLNQQTEAGVVYYGYLGTIQFIGRSYVNNLRGATPASIGRSTGATTLAYESFTRLSLGQTFINSTTVSPDGLSSVTASNSTSVTTYGQNGQTISSVDSTTTQATGLAEWIANTLSDPNSLKFMFSWTDVAQNEYGLRMFCEQVFGLGAYPYLVHPLSYRVPAAGSDTTVEVLIEGWTMNVTPEQSRFTMYASPLTYYQFFTLDSSTLGVLNTSRLGW